MIGGAEGEPRLNIQTMIDTMDTELLKQYQVLGNTTPTKTTDDY